MIPQIHPTDFHTWLQEARPIGPPIVLDVREPHEINIASLTPDNFTLVCIPMGEITSRLAEIPLNQPIACLCHHGARSLRVAMFLQSSGYTHVANIAGGIDAWSAHVDPSIARY
jgi:rhodanese-related sulfurtransferase